MTKKTGRFALGKTFIRLNNDGFRTTKIVYERGVREKEFYHDLPEIRPNIIYIEEGKQNEH